MLRDHGKVVFPKPSNLRILMMPIDLGDPSSIPPVLDDWKSLLETMIAVGPYQKGVGYITIDQMIVRAGVPHRRPGLHVDGVGPEGYTHGGWGGGGWSGRKSFLVAASQLGCRAWDVDFGQYDMVADGDCEHLRHLCPMLASFELQPYRIYEIGRLTPHETFGLPYNTARQFIRLSSPSTEAPTHEGLTENPLGVRHTGEILPSRPEHFRSWGDRHSRVY